MEIAGNVALVSGGAGGLGTAVAHQLHRLGATVVVFDRDGERAAAVANDLGERAHHVAGDATSEEGTQRAVDLACGVGPLRMVVACAGGGRQGQRTVTRDSAPHDLALFTETLELNVVTTFNALRLAAAAMAQVEPAGDDGERGVIVMTSSISGFEGPIGTLAYGTAKAAINGMTLIAARDLAALGIRVNAIAPGTMATAAWDAANPDVRAALEGKVPFPRRFGQPREFADLAAHLITNSYINGHVVRLDGAIRFDPK
jgi:NAD(P)-dependent dehydrogenase (short-subunit alcohol dehydrogenase family)